MVYDCSKYFWAHRDSIAVILCEVINMAAPSEQVKQMMRALVQKAQDEGVNTSSLSGLLSEAASSSVPFPDEFEILTMETRGAMTDGSKRRFCEKRHDSPLPDADEEQMPITSKFKGLHVPKEILPDGIMSFEQWASCHLEFGRYGAKDLCYGELVISEKEEHMSYVTWVKNHPKVSKDPRYLDLVAFINAYLDAKKEASVGLFPSSSYVRRFKKIS